MSFTPGPYQYNPDGNDWGVIVAHCGKEIAHIMLPYKASAAVEQATGRLLAASHELLEALEAMMGIPGIDANPEYYDAVDAVRKARGDGV